MVSGELPGSGGLRWRESVGSACAFGRDVICGFVQDNGVLMAAAVSFYVFLSLVPLLLLGVAVIGFVLGSPERAEAVVFSFVSQYSPEISATQSGGVIRAVTDSVVQGRGTATGIGLPILIWAGAMALVQLQAAVNIAWDIRERRRFFAQWLVAIVMLLVAGALLAASLAATSTLEATRQMRIPLFGLILGDWPWIWTLAGYVIPLLISIAAFTLVYKIMPNTRVALGSALAGGVFAGVLWEAAKIGFSLYVTRFAAFNRIYGSLAGVIVLLVWINYSSIVTILGAEVASVWAKRHSNQVDAAR